MKTPSAASWTCATSTRSRRSRASRMGRSAVKSACSLCHGDLGVSTRTVPTVTVEPACEACWSKIEAGALDLPAMERSPPDPGSRAELVERIVHAASRAAMFFGEQAAEEVGWG